MTTTDTSKLAELAALALDGSWIHDTRTAVTDEYGCGVCLDFGYLDGLGPCPYCDPDGFAEHCYYAAQQASHGLAGPDPWAGTNRAGTRADIVGDRA